MAPQKLGPALTVGVGYRHIYLLHKIITYLHRPYALKIKVTGEPPTTDRTPPISRVRPTVSCSCRTVVCYVTTSYITYPYQHIAEQDMCLISSPSASYRNPDHHIRYTKCESAVSHNCNYLYLLSYFVTNSAVSHTCLNYSYFIIHIMYISTIRIIVPYKLSVCNILEYE